MFGNPPNKCFKVKCDDNNDNEAQIKYMELKNSFASSENREPMLHLWLLLKSLENISEDSSNSLFTLKFYCLEDSDSWNLLRGLLNWGLMSYSFIHSFIHSFMFIAFGYNGIWPNKKTQHWHFINT